MTTFVNGHEIYEPGDFKDEDESRLVKAVVEDGLDVCKHCSEYEAGLDNLCPETKHTPNTCRAFSPDTI